jgi:lysophospholipase L1-like esterase
MSIVPGVTLCFLGDSFSLGVGDATRSGWVGRLMAADDPTGRRTVYALGVRGHTSRDIAARWLVEAESRLRNRPFPAVVFCFGANDAATAPEGGSRLSPDETLAATAEILENARARWPVLQVGPLPISDDPAADARIATLCPRMEALCAGLAVPYIPVFAAMMENAAWRQGAARGDGTHPDGVGYQALADYLKGMALWRNWLNGLTASA